jgi:hypothetical protein
MKATIVKNRLAISLPVFDKPRSSKSGKPMLIASSRGSTKTSVVIDGKPVYANVNAYIKNDAARPKTKARKAQVKP